MSWIMKGKMVCAKSSCNLMCFTRWNDAKCGMNWRKSFYRLLAIAACSLLIGWIDWFIIAYEIKWGGLCFVIFHHAFPEFYIRKQVILNSNYAFLTLSIASWNLTIPLSLSFVLWHMAKSFLCKCLKKLIEKYCQKLASWLFLLYICHAISFVLCPIIGHDAMQNLCNNPF